MIDGLSFLLTVLVLAFVARTDLQNRLVDGRILLVATGVGAVLGIASFNLFTIAQWFAGMVSAIIFFWFIYRKSFKVGTKDEVAMAKGDFFILLAIQSLNPVYPIAFVSLLVYSIGAVIVFAYGMLKNKQFLPFAPFLLVSYVLICAFLL